MSELIISLVVIDSDCFVNRACKISFATCGGVTHWALTDDDNGGVMTVGWGQNATNSMWKSTSCRLSLIFG